MHFVCQQSTLSTSKIAALFITPECGNQFKADHKQKHVKKFVFLNLIPDVELYHGHGGQNKTSVEHSSATKLSDVTLGIWNWFGNSYLFFLHKLFWPKLWSWSLDQENDGDGGWSQKKSWRSSVRGKKNVILNSLKHNKSGLYIDRVRLKNN